MAEEVEEEVTEAAEAETSTMEEAEAESEAEMEVEIDVNTALLEIMIVRTEIFDKLLRNEIELSEAVKLLEAVSPLEERVRRRRRRKK